MKLLFLDKARRIVSGNVFKHKYLPYISFVIKDLCMFKLQKNVSKSNKSFMVVKHVNKLVDIVNLPRIVNDSKLISLFPAKSEMYSAPGISFSYTKTIRSTICNYSQAIRDPNFRDFVCNCHSYNGKFIDGHHGHVYTGDVNIISNKELRALVDKGLGYHEQQPPDKSRALSAIVTAIDSYIESVSTKMSLPILAYKAWRVTLVNKVKAKLRSSKPYRYNNVLSKPEVIDELAKLQSNQVVFVPVDKAPNNVAIICKKYYLEVMTKEIRDSSTFERVDIDKGQLLTDLTMLFPNAKVKERYPFLYATAKMHKTPINFRFITSGRECLFSKLSIAVSKCLKLLVKTARKSFGYRIKEIDNCIFIIDNRDRVIKFLDASNSKKGNNKSISTWDFSTLYTKIPHNKLKDKMASFINRVFIEVAKSKKR